MWKQMLLLQKKLNTIRKTELNSDLFYDWRLRNDWKNYHYFKFQPRKNAKTLVFTDDNISYGFSQGARRLDFERYYDYVVYHCALF